MSCERCGFSRHPFHQVAVAQQYIGVMIDNMMTRAVVTGGKMTFRDGHTDAVGKSLAEWPGSRFYTGREAALRVARCTAIPLAKPFEVFKRKVIASEIEQAVEQHRSMARRQNEPIPIEPKRIGRVMLKKSCPQDIGHRRGAQWEARMATVGF